MSISLEIFRENGWEELTEKSASFDIILGNEKPTPLRITAEKLLRELEVEVDSDAFCRIAFTENVKDYTLEKTKRMSYRSLDAGESVYLIVKLEPEMSGDYKISLNLSWLEK